MWKMLNCRWKRSGGYLPFRDASSGFMSKTSTPCILPRISRRSRPVAWSRSVGMVPTAPPDGIRSSSVLISATSLSQCIVSCGPIETRILLHHRGDLPDGQTSRDVRSNGTIFALDSPILGSAFASPVANVSTPSRSCHHPVELPWSSEQLLWASGNARRTTDAEKARAAIGAREGVARARARAERRRNMVGVLLSSVEGRG